MTHKNPLTRTIVITFIFTILSTIGNAQLLENQRIDSLNTILQAKEEIDTTTIRAYYDLSNFYKQKQVIDSAKYYGQKAIEASLAIKDSSWLSTTLNSQGWNYLYDSQLKKSMEYAEMAKKITLESSKGDYYVNNLFDSYDLMSQIYSEQNQYGNALKTLLSAKNINDNNPNKIGLEMIVLLYSNFGYIYTETENYTEALKMTHKSIDLAKTNNLNSYLVSSYNTLAILYSKQKEFEKAIEYHDQSKALAIASKDSFMLTTLRHNAGISYLGLKNYDKALEELHYAEKEFINQGYKYGVVDNFLHLGKTYNELGQQQKAITYFNKTINLGREINATDNTLNAIIELGTIASGNRNYKEAITLLENDFSFINNSESSEVKRNAYEFLYTNYSKLGMAEKALTYYTKHKQLSDSIYSLKRMNQVETLKAEFEFEKMNANLKQKDTALQLANETKKSSQRLYLFFIIVFVLLAGFLVYAYIRQKKLIKTRQKAWDAQKELSVVKREQLNNEISFKNQQITDFAIHIAEKNDLLEALKKRVSKLKSVGNFETAKISDILMFINEDISRNKEKVQLYSEIDNTADSFYHKLSEKYSNLTEKEKRIATLVRLNQTSKQISIQLNITPASVDNYRSSIRKKMNIDKNIPLNTFIKQI